MKVLFIQNNGIQESIGVSNLSGILKANGHQTDLLLVSHTPDLIGAILRFNAQLAKRPYSGLTYQWRLIDGERHAGTKAESYNRGVRFAFAPRAPKD